ncbi:MAG TPA: phosphatase PAP2 family protein [Opitutaceae bacterium]
MSAMILQLIGRWRQAGWSGFVLLVALAALCTSLWVFVELADDAPEGDYVETEARILRAFRQPGDLARGVGPGWLPEVARDVTALGSAAVLTLMVLLVLGFLLLRRQYGAALFVFVASLGGWLLSDGLKEVFGRERPDVVPHLMEESSASFPSGHSMVSSVIYLTLGSLLGQIVARRREKIYFVHAAMLLTFLIGVSRVYLGVHYPTDVLAGWSAGTAWALLCWLIAWWLQRRGKIERPAPNGDGDA